ncbi:response regulator [bacterium]|nr:response regulator [bacterium]
MADKQKYDNIKIPLLVVDDDPFLRDVLKRFLSRKGYVVAVAEDADEAISYSREIPFRIAVIDIFIHGMDGIKLAEELKKAIPSLIIIIMTGHPSLDTALTALKQGVQDYLIKPFALEQIEESITRCLREKKIVEENNQLKERIEVLAGKVEEYEKILHQTHVIHSHPVADLQKQKVRGDAVYRDQSVQSIQERLKKLLLLKEEGIIPEEEYQLRRSQLLKMSEK